MTTDNDQGDGVAPLMDRRLTATCYAPAATGED